jgi:hypothetical protein
MMVNKMKTSQVQKEIEILLCAVAGTKKSSTCLET